MSSLVAPDTNTAPATSPPQVSVLIPAHNEAGYIAACLTTLFASELPEGMLGEALVLANGCSDATASLAAAQTVPSHWQLRVFDLPEGNKLKALNAGDAEARGAVLIYLDADVTLEPELVGQIATALDCPEARYASGTPTLSRADSRLTRAYGRFWMRLPFVQKGTPGFGLFAMNRAGRARWQSWPDIIADDTFARLSFTPDERIKLSARYAWPMVEGFRNLTRVRRRQNAGVAELSEKYPELLANDDKLSLSPRQLFGFLRQDPIGFAAYALVSLAVKSPLFRSRQRWTRGR
ncbi:glycosyltransferase family 2 protein [Pseudophaeobacter sp. EL27]|uniref:glycosyltransferase n=1 Tax=Pseudophaeobacter sp. EL27 TaxID=2107580 RepID=UPI000EFD9970|nr:glycosyltransferase [Pseudophaeobacter sp. EL27]